MTPFQNITLEMDKFKVIQRFVVLMYAKTSDLLTVNSERMDMFFKKNQNLDIIPPTENALLQHCKRAIYQTGVWSRCLEPNQNLPSPSNFGWKRSTDPNVPWEPVWITNGEASRECREFVKCSCQGAAGCVRCKCFNADMRCTMLCNYNCLNRIS